MTELLIYSCFSDFIILHSYVVTTFTTTITVVVVIYDDYCQVVRPW